MRRSTLIFLLILAVLAGLLGYNYFVQPFADLKPETESALTETPETQLSADPIMNLTPTQLVTQLIAYPLALEDLVASFSSDTPSPQLTWIEQYQPGSVLIFGSELSSSSAQLAETQLEQLAKKSDESWPVPWLIVDHEGGSVQRLSGEGFTWLPSWRQLCQTETEFARELLNTSAQELAASGLDVVLSPVVDLATGSGQLGSRTCDADPNQVIDRAQDYIRSFKAAGILPVIKHFPGIGRVEVDLHDQFANVSLTASDLRVFERLLNQDRSLGVMVTHVGVANQYPDKPCSLNHDCVTDLSQYFPGVLVISDALEMTAAGVFPDQVATAAASEASSSTNKEKPQPLSLAKRAVAAVAAGNNLLTFSTQVTNAELDLVVQALVEAYQQHPDFAQQVEASVKKLWQYRQLYQN